MTTWGACSVCDKPHDGHGVQVYPSVHGYIGVGRLVAGRKETMTLTVVIIRAHETVRRSGVQLFEFERENGRVYLQTHDGQDRVPLEPLDVVVTIVEPRC